MVWEASASAPASVSCTHGEGLRFLPQIGPFCFTLLSLKDRGKESRFAQDSNFGTEEQFWVTEQEVRVTSPRNGARISMLRSKLLRFLRIAKCGIDQVGKALCKQARKLPGNRVLSGCQRAVVPVKLQAGILHEVLRTRLRQPSCCSPRQGE